MKITLAFLIITIFVSCSSVSENNNSSPKYLTSHFVIRDQDTTSFRNDFFYYSLLGDSLGRMFYVLEDGCGLTKDKQTRTVGLNDTILISITATSPRRFDKEGKEEYLDNPDARIIMTQERGAVPVYETQQLCNHSLILKE